MRTIAERWALFRARVISPAAPAIQVREMKLAFYAGFKSCLDADAEIAEAAQDDDEVGVELLKELHAEAEAFGRSGS